MVAAVIQISSLVGEITDINANKHCKEGLSLSVFVSYSPSLSVPYSHSLLLSFTQARSHANAQTFPSSLQRGPSNSSPHALLLSLSLFLLSPRWFSRFYFCRNGLSEESKRE